MSAIQYEVGQEVMVPMRGLCEIKALETETILGQTLEMAVLKPRRGKTLIKIPIDKLDDQGVRELLSEEELLKASANTEGVMDLNGQDFMERLDRWTDMTRDGDYGRRILVLREIELVRKKGNLDKQEESFSKKVRTAARREIENVLKLAPSSAGRKLNLMLEEG